MKIAAITDIGSCRQENQDNYCAQLLAGGTAWGIVCDGMGGVNDSSEMAQKLANLIKGMGAHVNLIPINPVDGSPYSATDDANVHRFQKELEALGVNATVRRRLGTDISAACGQLRREDAQGK